MRLGPALDISRNLAIISDVRNKVLYFPDVRPSDAATGNSVSDVSSFVGEERLQEFDLLDRQCPGLHSMSRLTKQGRIVFHTRPFLLGRTAFGSPNSIYLSNPKNGHQTNRTVP